MREIRDRRDRTSWTSYPITQHVTQSSTPDTQLHLSYPDPDHSSASNSLSFTTSCHPSVSSAGSPHLPPSPPPSALLPPLPPVYNLQHQHHRLFSPAIGPHRVGDGPQPDQNTVQHYPPPDHLHRQLAPLPPSFTMMSETWYGLIQTPRDAYLLLEACRIGKLHRITRRLTDLERSQIIRPGAVFVWEEKEAGIKRWTDHVRWSPSRVSGAFLIYSELLSASSRDSQPHPNDPLLKQSFSSTTLDGDKLHLIAYYSKAALDSGLLPTPTADSRLREIIVPPGIYPDHRATGGVEDDSARERKRTSLIPRSSNSSLLQTVHSSTSAESASSSVDTARMQPVTPTSASLPNTEHGFSHRSSFTAYSTHRTAPDSKNLCAGEPKYSPPSYFGRIYPISQGVVDTHAPLGERSGRLDPYQQLPDWANSSGVVSSTSDGRGGYGRTGTPGGSVSMGPTLAPLTAWPNEPDRERAHERRLSAPGHSANAGNMHGFHPYVRHNETRSSNKDPRIDQSSGRGQSYEPPTAPGTPNIRPYTLPALHHSQSHSQPSGSMGPPTSTQSESPKSTIGAQAGRSGEHYPSLSPSFGSPGGFYQLHPSVHTNPNEHFGRVESRIQDQKLERRGHQQQGYSTHLQHQHHPHLADPFPPSSPPKPKPRLADEVDHLTQVCSNVDPSNLSHELSQEQPQSTTSLQRSDPMDAHQLTLSMDRYGGFNPQFPTNKEDPEAFVSKSEEPN
ncbi:hypothetical protein CROQUDRAFT_668880 [Cronartium quercuum f. sp. fusiforme G11]|uniref:Uncharacterized protein n=1 Tax=Cronartium quercuum f. sp. fusiforme G11 TaxID=708437 RepID=A0A9P6NMR5_9BASI|nr:hypothetical protein CROQUDRAFT_668880 [Cronartium quercuum f. sp. fusiforme G11]